jgi:hypothetical protein
LLIRRNNQVPARPRRQQTRDRRFQIDLGLHVRTLGSSTSFANPNQQS